MRIRRVIAATILALLLLAAVAGVWMWRTISAAAVTPGAATQVGELQVAQGASLRSVLKQLEERQLIGNAQHFEWYLRCCRPGKGLAASGIKAGRYRIAPGQQPLAGVHRGIDAVLEFLRATTTLADVREELTVIDVLGSAERAAVLCHVTGHRAGEVVLDNLTVHVHRVADGRVAEIRFHHFDQMGVDAFWAA